MTKIIEGGCSCKHLRYELTELPMFVHSCHCHLCKQQTGSSFITHAFIESSNFAIISGALKSFKGPTGSGRPHFVDRCKLCSCAIISYYAGQRNYGVVKVGTLDNPEQFAPQAHVWTKYKLSWIGIPEDVPNFEEFYDFEATWPKEGFTRLRKVLSLPN